MTSNFQAKATAAIFSTPGLWKKLQKRLWEVHGPKVISGTEMEALRKIFTESPRTGIRDYSISFDLFAKMKGNLFWESTSFQHLPTHKSAIILGCTPENRLMEGNSSVKRKLYRTGGCIVKTYTSEPIRQLYWMEDFRREVLYGGLLTLLRSDLFSGCIRYYPGEYTVVVAEEPGVDGFNYLTTDPAPPASDRRLVALNAITAVRTMHSLGFIHSDIKLENMMVNPDTLSVKLIDFEHTSLVVTRGGRRTTPIGTYGYCLPLLYATSFSLRIPASQWTDIYAMATSLLCLLFEIGLNQVELENEQLLLFPKTAESRVEHPDARHLQEHVGRQEALYKCFATLMKRPDRADFDLTVEFMDVMHDIIAFDLKQLVKAYKTPEKLWVAIWQAVVNLEPH